MNKQEHLLVCMAEECSEIQHAIAKALRFGVDDHGHSERPTNRVQLRAEFNDLLAVAEMLEEHGFNFEPSRIDIAAKKKRVAEYMEYASGNGTLTPNA